MALRIGLCHGGGLGVYEESARALELLRAVGAEVTFIAVNEAGIELPRLDHWGTLHPNKLPVWTKMRADLGNPDGYATWSLSKHKTIQNVIRQWRAGSSGLHSLDIGINGLGLDGVIGCGVHIDDRPNQFSKKPWVSCKSFRRGWQNHEVLPVLRARARCMSTPHPVTGEPPWTVTLIGEPTEEWLTSLMSVAA